MPQANHLPLPRSACLEENTTWDLVKYDLSAILAIEFDVLNPLQGHRKDPRTPRN